MIQESPAAKKRSRTPAEKSSEDKKEAASPAKRGRGRPKGSGKKAGGAKAKSKVLFAPQFNLTQFICKIREFYENFPFKIK